MLEHGAIEHMRQYPPLRDVDHALKRAQPAIAQGLIGPAERVPCHDHVLELEEGIAGRNRLGLEDIQAGALDPLRGERLDQAS